MGGGPYITFGNEEREDTRGVNLNRIRHPRLIPVLGQTQSLNNFSSLGWVRLDRKRFLI